ncbi:NACHT domain-containing protein [Streptomyces phaeochromogenes]|uniref:NACHT domain-containing protein n=1 Tax=Streptomyces phaeochromogenes TaxID=1923 RepID=A0ABZ1HRN5_STRPH|nr:NACHT domain-containing protein [Streptomyces phaeochromogenes]WSD21267.1 NACHT domain-containing protein [Streptomyces phaeochromogenes]
MDEDKVLEQLAVAVSTQWDNEAAVRRVNDPYPLPVAWEAAGDDLAEDWSLLTSLACAWPGGPPGDPALWPTDGAGLAGRNAEIGQVLSERVPTRRLVILGEPGAGKSVLLIRLLQDIIARRAAGDPVPVLFSLASWDPHQPLKTWMAGQLRRTHPGLATVAPLPVTLTDTTDRGPSDLALYLLNAGLILPLLDGFDELPPARHATALDMLNRALPTRQPLVLTSRTDPYRTALTRPITTVRLNGAAAIQLLPLKAEDAADYLCRDAGGRHTPAAHRWNTVIAHLGTASAVGQALATPLGLFLARTIYNPRPDTPSVPPPVPHPDELCDTAVYIDRGAINTHLFRAFIPAAYTPYQPNPPRWTAEQAHRTFVFLAQFQQNQRTGSPDIAWWELRQAIPRHTLRPLVGLVSGLVVGLVVGLTLGLTLGPVVGLVAGLVAGIMNGLMDGLMVGLTYVDGMPGVRLRRMRSELRVDGLAMLVGWLMAGLMVFGGLGLAAGLVVGIEFGFTAGLTAGLSAGLAFAIGFGLAAGLATHAPDLTANSGPVRLLALDRRTFLAVGLLETLTFGLAAGLVAELVGGLAVGLAVGLGVGLGLGLLEGLNDTAWGVFVIACAYFVVRRKIPRHLMEFLHDAHEHRGVLRQAGAVYQFRHIDLQRHLAQ